ncbi:MAG: hypothetical protein M1819_001934 [Sarea resinae]|nr:MAG: hypothetical protein M1819_001934 [Sarea resinae]
MSSKEAPIRPNDEILAAADAEATNARSRRDRPCDACRRRKSRCVINDGAKSCVMCDFHGQDCTFVQEPQPRKRRANPNVKEEEPSKRRSPEVSSHPKPLQNAAAAPSPKTEEPEPTATEDVPPPTKSLGLQPHAHSKYVGRTTELEHALLDLCDFDCNDESTLSFGTLRRVSDSDTFLMLPDKETHSHEDEIRDLEALESIVAPHGPDLVKLYFRIVHPNFPILQKEVFLEQYSKPEKEVKPALLAAVYILALNWWAREPNLASHPTPEVKDLEAIALKWIGDVTQQPKFSTVQAGLLLLQRPEVELWNICAQLLAFGQELGLHLDCTSWRIPTWERGLRKRLAWALYMQDKWSSLVQGRPSHISAANWAVKPLVDEDFSESMAEDEKDDDTSDVSKGKTLFSQMIDLTRILSEVLDTFYTQKAIQEVNSAGREGTRLILERAKPVQIKLKDWFSRLPACLKMDNVQTGRLSATGYLHLAYFATEITLHRRIVRSLTSSGTDPYLVHICRSAAKTRLISAMDFVNRLRPEHLQSFWYFTSKVNFTLIGTFGTLLRATAPVKEEAEFYQTRLREYRWTLSVSSKSAKFLDFAVSRLIASSAALRNMPEKPSLSLEASFVGGPPSMMHMSKTISPPGEGEDEDMTDVPPGVAFDISGSAFSMPPGLSSELIDPSSGLASPSTSSTSSAAPYEASIGPFSSHGTEGSVDFISGGWA